jgi:hypothetical protein
MIISAKRKIILTIFILIFLLSPFSHRGINKAESFLGTDLPLLNMIAVNTGVTAATETAESTIMHVVNAIAWATADYAIEKIANATVNWINGGFGEGGPKYVRDFGGFMGQLGDDVAGEFISGTGLGFVCEPLRAQFRIALARLYTPETRINCTLSEVVDNVEGFIDGNFSDGGWEAWGRLVTTSNPYTHFLRVENELREAIAARKEEEKAELEWGQGFMSWKTCPSERYQCRCAHAVQMDDEFPGGRCVFDGEPTRINLLPSFSSDAAGCEEANGVHECVEGMKTNTPGSVINDQLNNSLGAGLHRLTAADEINELVGALLNQLISDLFKREGLFGSNPAQHGYTNVNSPQQQKDMNCYNYGICDPLEPDFRYQLCAKNCEQKYCTEESREENGGENNQEQYTEGNLICEDIQHDACVDQCAIDFPPDGSIPGTGSGMCTDCICEGQPDETKNHRSVVEDAITATLEDHPDYQLALNNDENRFAFIKEVVATINEESEFDWFGAVIPLNANDNPTSGDLIAIWRNGDEFMERYDILASKDKESTIGDAKQAGYTGDIYLQCHPEGNRAGLTPPLSDNGGSGTTYGNDSGAPDSIELVDVRWIDNSDVGDWDETSRLRVKILSEGSQIDLEYDKKNVWPQKTQINGTVVVGNAWIVVWRGGEWVAGTFEWMGPGQTKKDTKNFVTHSAEIADNNNKLDNFQPQSDETYGFVVSTLVRLGKKSRDSQDNWVRERTNISTVVWP